MFSSAYAFLSKEARNVSQNVPDPSPFGDIAQIMAAVGQIGGAMYAAWAMGDGWGEKNKVLRKLIKEKAKGAIVGLLANLGGTAIGKKMANGLGAWGGGLVGGSVGAGAVGYLGGNSASDIARDIGLGVAQNGLNMARGAVGTMVSGFAVAAGFYGGTVEYLSDSAFSWWK
jgi:hypothetical protein